MIRHHEPDLQRARFAGRPGNGSHRQWEHSLMPDRPVTMPGSPGADARRYQETQVRETLAELERRHNQ